MVTKFMEMLQMMAMEAATEHPASRYRKMAFTLLFLGGKERGRFCRMLSHESSISLSEICSCFFMSEIKFFISLSNCVFCMLFLTIRILLL